MEIKRATICVKNGAGHLFGRGAAYSAQGVVKHEAKRAREEPFVPF